MKTRILPVIVTAAITSLITIFAAAKFHSEKPYWGLNNSAEKNTNVSYAGFTGDGAITIKAAAPVDFQQAAEASVKAVVHIKTSTKARTVAGDESDDFLSQLFGQRQYTIPGQIGSGSGVVISADGYIVTNNHVVAGADEVTVTFNNRHTTQAKVISTDASTDIAVLKVDEKNLPYMEFGNSDDVHLGQWVLAVGYPLTLDATVTAGIISAKSRSIGVNRQNGGNNAIESYLQTDAAVNPGNSGGALVNTSGQLIGINAAIASPTGSYAGYSYAIPSNIVRKAVNDLVKYGSVQRGYMGIQYMDLRNASQEDLKKLGIDYSDGVYVSAVTDNSGAQKAGIQKGDFIIEINGTVIHTEPELQGEVARYHPGDNITVSYLRSGKTYHTSVLLKNSFGNTEVVKANNNTVKAFGAEFRELTAQEKNSYGISEGVVVSNINKGLIAKQTDMRKGFIVLSMNDVAITSLADIEKATATKSGILKISGTYPGSSGMYYYSLKNVDSMGDTE